MTALRVCTMFWWFLDPYGGRIASGWMMSIYSFQRWASDDFGPVESRAWSKRLPYMWILQAPHWSARLAVSCSKARTASARAAPKGHLPKPMGYTYGLMLYWAKNRKYTQRTGRMHVIIASQEGDFVRTSHGPQTLVAPHLALFSLRTESDNPDATCELSP